MTTTTPQLFFVLALFFAVCDSFNSLSDPCVASPISNCAECTAKNVTDDLTLAWCANPQFCFVVEQDSPCLILCSGGYYSEGQTNQCDSLSAQSTVTVMMILIVCPLCLVGGCVYITFQRLRNAALNKVYTEFDERLPESDVRPPRPIPLLQVHSTASEDRIFNRVCIEGVSVVYVQAETCSGEIPAVMGDNAVAEARQVT